MQTAVQSKLVWNQGSGGRAPCLALAEGLSCHAPRARTARRAQAGTIWLASTAGMLGHTSETITGIQIRIVDKVAESPVRSLRNHWGSASRNAQCQQMPANVSAEPRRPRHWLQHFVRASFDRTRWLRCASEARM